MRYKSLNALLRGIPEFYLLSGYWKQKGVFLDASTRKYKQRVKTFKVSFHQVLSLMRSITYLTSHNLSLVPMSITQIIELLMLVRGKPPIIDHREIRWSIYHANRGPAMTKECELFWKKPQTHFSRPNQPDHVTDSMPLIAYGCVLMRRIWWCPPLLLA